VNFAVKLTEYSSCFCYELQMPTQSVRAAE